MDDFILVEWNLLYPNPYVGKCDGLLVLQGQGGAFSLLQFYYSVGYIVNHIVL